MKIRLNRDKLIWGVQLFSLFTSLYFDGLNNFLPLAFLIVSGTTIFSNYVLQQVQKYYHTKQLIHINHLIQAMVLCGISGITYTIFQLKFELPTLDFSIYVLQFSFSILLIVYYWHERNKAYTQQIEKWLEREKELLIDQKIKEFESLYKPHFLFNSLNTIYALQLFNPEKAQKSTLLLSDYLRVVLEKRNQKFHTIQEEFNHLERYLELEKVRFEERLTVHTPNISEYATCLIPVFITQPLIENAIRFGLDSTQENVIVSVDLSAKQGYLIITITNPYTPKQAALNQTGFGLKSIQERLYLIYQQRDLIQINATQTTFEVHLSIPKQDRNHVN